MPSVYNAIISTSLLLSMLASLTFATGVPGPINPALVTSRTIKWRWVDDGKTVEKAKYSGEATITWVRDGGCKTKDEAARSYSRPVNVTVTPYKVDGQSSGDYLSNLRQDPWGRPGRKSRSCDSRTDVRLDIIPGVLPYVGMRLEISHICTDANCKEDDSPNVQCLIGNSGYNIEYMGKWIDKCRRTL